MTETPKPRPTSAKSVGNRSQMNMPVYTSMASLELTTVPTGIVTPPSENSADRVPVPANSGWMAEMYSIGPPNLRRT